MVNASDLSYTSFRHFSLPAPEQGRVAWETPPLNWTTFREGLALLALFGSLYGWFWLGWAMGPA